MALLTTDERKAIFKELGLGEYNEKNIKAFQKKYMLRASDADGKYGVNTDNTLRTVYYVKVYTKNFKPEEFRCECGGRYCCGYPSYMKPAELIHIQSIRDHYGRPITVTCGLRCKTWNSKLGGSIQNSLHMSGLAIDFYQNGVTDTLANRKASIKWIKKQPAHHYTYGNGINSYGNGVSAPYMGNALHTDCYDRVEPVHPKYDGGSEPTPTPQPTPQPVVKERLTVDGIGGKDTVKAMQEYFGCVVDGVISGQRKTLKKFYPALTAVEFGKGGSPCIKKMQKWLGTEADGIWGEYTSMHLQKKLGVNVDGIFGANSMKALQRFLNKELSAKGTDTSKPIEKPSTDATQPSTPIVDEGKAPYKVIDVSDWQSKIDWQKVRASGVVGAIIRYGDGSFIDTRFDENMRNAKAAGLHIGAYIYSRATSKEQARNEAERLFNACKPYAPDMPLYIDLEAKGYGKYADDVAIAFLNKIKALGGRGGVYANLNWWNNYLKKTAKDYSSNAFWIAQYNDTMDYKPASKMGMWQYSSSGTVSGIKGRVDMNKCFVAYWEKAKPTEPAKPAEPTDPPKKSIDELAIEVLQGKWGKGDERKKKIEDAGYDYDAVQKCVNEIVAKLNKIMDACKTQAEWMKDSVYDWQSNPTIEKSKKRGTCVTYVACVLQRLGILPSGKYIWHDEGKVYGNNSKMEVIYPNNKTLHQLKGELIEGDIIIDGDKHDNGSGSHIFVLTGAWKGDNPVIWDNHSAQDKGGKKYTYTRNRTVIAIIRLNRAYL